MKVNDSYDYDDTIKIGVDVDTDKIDEVKDILEDTKTRIYIKNNKDVHITIHNYNCTHKEYMNEEE